MSAPCNLTVHIETSSLDCTEHQRLLEVDSEGCGGIATFVGRVRGDNGDREVTSLHLDHYPGMTESLIEQIAREAIERWPLGAIRIVHRVGTLHPGDSIVFVGAASAHRDAAFDACRFLIDQLKTRATFWKREEYPDGSEWLDDRASDRAATKRWQE